MENYYLLREIIIAFLLRISRLRYHAKKQLGHINCSQLSSSNIVFPILGQQLLSSGVASTNYFVFHLQRRLPSDKIMVIKSGMSLGFNFTRLLRCNLANVVQKYSHSKDVFFHFFIREFCFHL